MAVKVSMRDVRVSWLNTRSLVLVSKFARVLNRYNGSVISLQNENLIAQIMIHARAVNDPELQSIYSELKAELTTILQNPAMERAVSEVSVPYNIAPSISELEMSKSL